LLFFGVPFIVNLGGQESFELTLGTVIVLNFFAFEILCEAFPDVGSDLQI